jgi:hypothetical protein
VPTWCRFLLSPERRQGDSQGASSIKLLHSSPSPDLRARPLCPLGWDGDAAFRELSFSMRKASPSVPVDLSL